ncbi:uncharacterized protein [Diabrotica undecimpunctata]|uniref:uncharacterized protein n=1 Tax=Diabrotica undecimpunctata TaxID=50387 RepID=UPI003B63882B
MTSKHTSMPSNPTSNWRQSGSGADGVKWATGHDVVRNQARHGNSESVINIKIWSTLKIGTWSVRGFLEPGKLDVVENEIHNFAIVGLSETHWKDKEHYTSKNGNDIYFSGNDNESRNGVAVIVNNAIKTSVKEYITVSDWIIVVRMNASPVNRRGERLLHFCIDNNLFVTNTGSQHHHITRK